MKAKRNMVLLFEDDDKRAKKLVTAIGDALSGGALVERFVPTELPVDPEGTYEDRLLKELADKRYQGVSLVVCDRDLSKIKSYSGLSEAIVSKVADRLGIPVCLYATGLGEDSVLERQRDWGDGRIVLDCQKPAEMAAKIDTLMTGFGEVGERVDRVLAAKSKQKLQSPAEVVAAVLERPASINKISQYISGDQKMVAEILPYAKSTDKKELRSRLPTLVGYWIYDSILRYPGLLVNKVAAASYLNISVAEFEKGTAIQGLFKSALYGGPFSDSQDPLWWRDDLDDILQEAGCDDGRDYVKKKLRRTVKPCMCSVDPLQRAGWYCMVNRLPVSFENSMGNITWFPPGADLARITRAIYDEIGPWLGLY